MLGAPQSADAGREFTTAGFRTLLELRAQPLAESPRPWLSWVAGAPELRNGRPAVADAPGFGEVLGDGAP